MYAHHFGTGPESGDVSDAEMGRQIHDLFRLAEQAITAPLLDWLDARGDVTLVGPKDAAIHAPTIAIRVHNHPASFIARELAEHNVMVSSGDFYAVRVLEGMNIPLDPGVLRMSFVHYTSEEDVNQLMRALDSVL